MTASLRARSVAAGVLLASCYAFALVAHAQGNAQRGAKAFQTCAACHSLEPGRHLTGPSLGKLFGRKAGTIQGFLRYSDALKRSGVVWDEKTLDAWLKDPDSFIPGHSMTFPGINDDAARRDLIAYLEAADALPGIQRAGRRLPSLNKAGPDSIVKAIRYCGDTYFVTTGDGKMHKIWEFNLRFKTDTTDTGPNPGSPVLLGVGMRGDRAAIVFARPGEIGKLVKEQCG
jgi:cytochrome c